MQQCIRRIADIWLGDRVIRSYDDLVTAVARPVSDGRNIERGHDMTNTTGLEPVVDEMDRRAALVLGAAAAASVLAGGADVLLPVDGGMAARVG